MVQNINWVGVKIKKKGYLDTKEKKRLFTNKKEGTKRERKILELVEGKVRKIFERMREELIFLREMNKRKERPSGYLYICVLCVRTKRTAIQIVSLRRLS